MDTEKGTRHSLCLHRAHSQLLTVTLCKKTGWLQDLENLEVYLVPPRPMITGKLPG